MTLLSQVKKGKIAQPVLAICYGPDGVGKSTLAANAPNPIFLGTENGTANLDVARFPTPKGFKEILQAIDELTTQPHTYKTLAIDSLDWLEPLVWEHACTENNWKNIEEPGYGKGYVYANKIWMTFIEKLSKLREAKGMHIVAIAHSQVKLAKDPQAQGEYDRYQLKLNDKAAALWREYVDMVLFANFETIVHADKKGKTKALGDGARYLFTERRPGFDAKNRMGLPFQIPLTWQDLMDHVSQGNSESLEAILGNINDLIPLVDQATQAKVRKAVEDANGDVARLITYQNKLRALAQQGV